MEIGVNLPAIADYSTVLPFADQMKQCRPWETTGDVTFDEDGWPRLREGQKARTMVLREIGGAIPFQRAALTYEGDSGSLTVWGAASPVEDAPGEIVLQIDPDSHDGLIIDLEGGPNPDNSIREIELRAFGDERPREWRQAFVDQVREGQWVRTMDWQAINGSPTAGLVDVPGLHDYTQAGPNGVATELIAGLVNATGCHPYVHIPHLWEDRDVRQFAEVLESLIPPDTRLAVAYSNETWNFGAAFSPQNDWCRAQGQAMGLPGDEWEAGHRYHGWRTAEIGEIFRRVFGDRVSVIVESQAANAWVTRRRLDGAKARNASVVDGLAIAFYVGGDLGHSTGSAPPAKGMTVDEILSACEADVQTQMAGPVADQAALSRDAGLGLWFYELGSHLATAGRWHGTDADGQRAQEADELAIWSKFIAAERHDRMAGVYAGIRSAVGEVDADQGAAFAYHLGGRYGRPKWLPDEQRSVLVPVNGGWGLLEREFGPRPPKWRGWFGEDLDPPAGWGAVLDEIERARQALATFDARLGAIADAIRAAGG